MNDHLRELLGAAAELHTNAKRLCDRGTDGSYQASPFEDECRRSLARLDTILHVYAESPDEVVKTETTRELVAEIKDQYDRAKAKHTVFVGEKYDDSPKHGNLTAYLPFEMLREAFEAKVPDKE